MTGSGSQSPVTMYLESIVRRRSVCDCRAGMWAVTYPEMGGKLHVESVVSQPIFWMGIFQTLSLQQNQRLMAQAGATFHPLCLAGNKSVLFNEGLVASMKLFQSVSLQSGSCSDLMSV